MHCLLVSSCSLLGPLLVGLLGQLCGVEMATCGTDPDEAAAAIQAWRPEVMLLHGEAAREPLCTQLWSQLRRIQPCACVVRLQSDPPAVHGGGAVLDPPGRGWLLADLAELISELARQRQGADASRGLPPPGRIGSLAPRERLVLHRLGNGMTNREISGELGITLQTVETYRKALASKLGVRGSQLLRLAVLWRCTDPGVDPALALSSCRPAVACRSAASADQLSCAP